MNGSFLMNQFLLLGLPMKREESIVVDARSPVNFLAERTEIFHAAIFDLSSATKILFTCAGGYRSVNNGFSSNRRIHDFSQI
jgi:hypothetical protein